MCIFSQWSNVVQMQNFKWIVGRTSKSMSIVVVDAEGKLLYVIVKDSPLATEVSLIGGTTYKLAETEKIEQRIIPNLLHLRGYSDTEHGKKNKIEEPGGWQKFTMQDCSPPGKLDLH